MRHIRFIKQCDVIYAPQRRDQGHAFLLSHYRPAGIFDETYGFIAVYRDHEYVSHFPGCLQVSEVSDMKDVEAAIRKNDLLSFEQCGQFFELAQFHRSASMT